uniref:Uncharacterized protein n=1 Tax=Arundo donax TaxID=35708 RepID=A0A0A8Z6Y7_ARUDO
MGTRFIYEVNISRLSETKTKCNSL